MNIVRLIAILFVTSPAAGRQSDSASPSHTPEPKLPVIDYDACPGRSDPIPNVKLVREALIYSSPDNGKLVARVSPSETVTVLAGATVIRQPDKGVIKYVYPDNSNGSLLKEGDLVFGYGWHVDGNMVFWAKGVWFEENIEAVAEKGARGFRLGFGPGGCTIDIVKYGALEWWVKVKANNDVSGWVLAVRYDENNRWYRWRGNFHDVLQGHCGLD